MSALKDEDVAVQVGDWVAFMQNRIIAYARVEYLRKMSHWPWSVEAVTTAGTVPVNDVLEVRSERAK